MNGHDLLWFAVPATLCWLGAGAAVFLPGRKFLAHILMAAGTLVIAACLADMWRVLGRPPLRTLGETRLWYSFFLAGVGHITYSRWKYPWLLLFSGLLACLFTGITLLRPETVSTALPPALQSPFFIPHVTAYMLAYAILCVAAIAAFIRMRQRGESAEAARLSAFLDTGVSLGLGFLLIGMLTGAVWAKEAWGRYWSWDPKETWAFITAAAYLLYLHLRLRGGRSLRVFWLLPLAFVLLMIAWLGVSYLPAAQGSVHVY
jgi:ABC-type transport system involved in cytochrome c biogenesis permease subunit